MAMITHFSRSVAELMNGTKVTFCAEKPRIRKVPDKANPTSTVGFVKNA